MANQCFPSNINLVNAANFKLAFPQLTNLEYFCTSVTLPNIEINNISTFIPYGKKAYPIHGDKLNFSPLVVTFIVDEDFANWNEIFTWMRGLCSPESAEEYIAQKAKIYEFPIEGLYAQAQLHILNNSGSYNKKITFEHVVPTSLEGVTFNYQINEATVGVCSCTFDYSSFNFS